MFDRICLIKIAYAYSLFYDEIFELATRLTAYLKIGDGYILADRVNDLAEYFVERMPYCQEQVEMSAATASECYRILMPEQQRDIIRANCKNKSFYVMRCFVLGGLTVDKREAVHFLQSKGYAQKEEIKGLSSNFIDRIERERNYSCVRNIETTLEKILSKMLPPAHLAMQGKLSQLCSASSAVVQEDIRTPLRPKPGGSNKDTTRSEPTMIAAQNVFNDIQRHTDSNGKIAVGEFCKLVMDSMMAQGMGDRFHQEECKRWARTNLGQHKLGRGEKICKIKQ